jgi:signal peptide peptidase SppA
MNFKGGTIVGRPMAITPDALASIIAGKTLMAPAADVSGLLPRRTGAAQGSWSGSRIAVLPLYGTLSHRGWVDAAHFNFPGDTSLESFGTVFDQVLSDPSIESIVIDIDSPGGGVFGVDELGAKIFAARGKKRIFAIANSIAASAAYWIGTAADQFSVSPSGQVGSIGILAVHEDWSRAEDAAGIRVTTISSGKYKTEGNEHEPLDDTARAALQDRVASYHRMFIRAVARNRGVSFADVHDGFGEGRTVGAANALKMGMVDHVETIDELLARIASTPASAKIPRAAARGEFLNEVHAAQARLRDALARVGR